MNRRERMASVVVAAVLSMSSLAWAGYDYLDTFTLNGVDRIADATLSLQLVEQGQRARWEMVSGSLLFTESGTITPNATWDSWAKFTLTPSSMPVRVEADINPTGSAWGAVFVKGFSDSFTGVDGGQIWILLRPNGNYKVFGKGTTITIKQDAPCPNFVAGGMNHVAFEYYKDTNTLSVYLNGQKEIDNYNLSFTPAFNSTGFYFAAPTPRSSQIDNFKVSDPTAVVKIPGDANGDKLVDVGDLGILAANYGGTGKTWAEGDFNNDTIVDVGDLGILAANYGTGSGSTSSFDADYAHAFGKTVSSDVDEDAQAESSVCSSLGLPLIAGLVLVGLMLVKFEE